MLDLLVENHFRNFENLKSNKSEINSFLSNINQALTFFLLNIIYFFTFIINKVIS